MEAYDIWLFLHIGGAILWVGGGTALGALMGRLQKAQAGPAIGAVGAQMEFFSKALFIPASVVVLGAGIAMVLTNDTWNFEDPWIAIGLAGYVITMVSGMAIIGPTAKKLKELGPSRPPGDAEVAGLQAKMKRFSGLNTLVLWIVVIDMVFKPGR